MTPDRGRSDTRLLFATRATRMFAYGLLAVILGLYLAELGFGPRTIGLLITLTLVGDTVLSLGLTLVADRFGRRRTLVVGALMMAAAGVVFASTDRLWLLLVAATLGVISPSGTEVGPFLAVEHAALAQALPEGKWTAVLAWYNLAGSIATACGAIAAGLVAAALEAHGASVAASYRVLIAAYGGLGLVIAGFALRLSPAAEIAMAPGFGSAARARFGLHRSRRVVLELSSLFVIDAFAGGLVVQSLVAWWFHARFGLPVAAIGSIFFAANILAGISALAAAALARRFGLLNTMVFTHLPSNILLMLVPLMPSLGLAVAVFVARFSISQMDVPTRQAFLMAAVTPDERSAAGGVANVARTIGASASPALAGVLLAGASTSGGIFLLAGGLKVAYDLLLWRSFRAARRGAPQPG